jgi:uncharacterized protein (DUF427 family)
MMSPGLKKNPEHKLQTERITGQVEVFLAGEQIALSRNAIRLNEAGVDPVIYIPKNDLMNIDLRKFDDYICPYKGHAELYSIIQGGEEFPDAAFSFDRPFDEFLDLTGRVAFYPEKVEAIRISEIL